jgi:hypothetical protein
MTILRSILFSIVFVGAGFCYAQTNRNDTGIRFRLIENDGFYNNILNPVTILDSTKVYSRPDTTSEVLRVIEFNTELTLLREGNDNTNNWYEIESWNKIGYVKAKDIIAHSMMGDSNKYFIKNLPRQTMVYKYSLQRKQFMDTLEISIYTNTVEQIKHDGWKNVNCLFKISRISPTCGGGGTSIYIVDANNSLSELIRTGYNNTESIVDEPYVASAVYLPMKFMNGKILLVKDGDLKNIFDGYTGKLRTTSFPKDLTFPKEELVIKSIITEQAVLDANKKPIYKADEAWNLKTKTIIKNEYYRWNGKKLTLLKI